MNARVLGALARLEPLRAVARPIFVYNEGRRARGVGTPAV